MRVSPFAYLLAVTGTLVLATGCARTWPSVRPIGDPTFLERGGVVTVDVLPMDVGVAVSPTTQETPEAVADRFAAQAAWEVQQHLAGRGYAVTAMIGQDGVYEREDGSPALAMPPAELASLEASLGAYGAAQASARGVLLTPYLPSRLGTATGSDATLYVGGWAYAGEDKRGVTAGDVAKVVIIGLFIVVVVAVIAIAVRKGGGGGGGGGRGGGGGAVQAGGAAVKAVGSAGRVVARGLSGAARTSYQVLRALSESGDAWGRTHTHLNVYVALPVHTMPESGPSRTFLEMTLVDNHSGLVLWHARQQFPANPGKPDQVREVVATMMAGLPVRR